ncbi:ABC-2 family transporter protein [Frankia canadensis]|uniref:ABC-2 family transporter protein n=1 Tax=Frankia canadensis TaxID=1836972 RepID=A0A2I2KJD7_9ACTN|nr:hypothetical protein [Frankia canadensis]SNQ45770.1 ABC-2 family transporter protein [Frankia canadensis]SOU53060.1 ABC-2 family transporter protein [Frankia canadensis]
MNADATTRQPGRTDRTSTQDTASAVPRPAIGSRGGSRPPLTATLAAEWMRLRSIRSTWVLVAVGTVLGIAVAALLAVAVGATWDGWSAADRAEFDPVVAPLVGTVFTGVLVVVLGVKVGASEYHGGLARVTFAVTPRRGRVLAAKCLLVTLMSWAVMGVATVGIAVAARLVFGAYGVPMPGFGEAGALRAVATSVATSPLFPLLGLALAMMFRSAAGAISAVLGLLFAPAVLGGLLPVWWQRNVLAYLPTAASDSICFSHLEPSPQYLPIGAAILVVAGWLALSIGAAQYSLTTRDA